MKNQKRTEEEQNYAPDKEVKTQPLSVRFPPGIEERILKLAASWRPRLNKTEIVRMCVEEYLPQMERDAGLLPRAASPTDAVARLEQAASQAQSSKRGR